MKGIVPLKPLVDSPVVIAVAQEMRRVYYDVFMPQPMVDWDKITGPRRERWLVQARVAVETVQQMMAEGLAS